MASSAQLDVLGELRERLVSSLRRFDVAAVVVVVRGRLRWPFKLRSGSIEPASKTPARLPVDLSFFL